MKLTQGSYVEELGKSTRGRGVVLWVLDDFLWVKFERYDRPVTVKKSEVRARLEFQAGDLVDFTTSLSSKPGVILCLDDGCAWVKFNPTLPPVTAPLRDLKRV